MYLREFKNDVFVPLIISVGMSYNELIELFNNEEPGHKGEWGTPEHFNDTVAAVSLVADKKDENRYKILLRFNSEENMTMRNITHESFHVAISVCLHHGMALGFNVGEDEHAAHIAGWAAACCMKLLNEIKEKGEGENGEKEISGGVGEETH